MQAALLPDRGIIRISGADARRFLHGLLTADIETMSEATPRYAALLTPQGKIVADFLVVQSADAEGACFLLDCERSLAAMLVGKLNIYKLRAKVTVEDVSNTTAVLALWDDAPASAAREPGSPWFADPRLAALGWRAIVSPAIAADTVRTQGAALGDAAAYEAHRIALGVPRGGRDFAYGDAFPHEADMDQLNGVDFAKGCYVGQEVVSRMQHRGTVRNRVVPVLIDGVAPQAGTPVVAGEKTLGAMGSAAGGRGLALLRLDRVADAAAAGLVLVAGNARLRPVEPAWAGLARAGAAKAAG
ncbi:MAG: CAF17-like 4Fe-4S cluster assembly/insertion protein YgfZ [Rhodoplanes sp.]